VDVYATEEEQVESIKKWWKENGRSVIAGAMIGLGGVFGWRWWIEHRQQVAENASSAFEQLLTQAGSGDTATALDQAQRIDQGFGGTAYATFSPLVIAEVKYRQGDKAGARAELEKAISKAPDPGMRTIAVLRLARILLDSGDAAGAAALLSRHPATGSFAGDYAALSGDIALAQGDTAGARNAYAEALKKNASSAALIQIKLDNLPPAG
jgi:predicted negative regulator of RcsB-dependent stress response